MLVAFGCRALGQLGLRTLVKMKSLLAGYQASEGTLDCTGKNRSPVSLMQVHDSGNGHSR